MKTVWNIVSIVLLINVLVMIGIGVKLYADGRINRDRIAQTVEIFRPTLEEEEQAREEREKARLAALDEEAEQTWRQQVKDGPQGVEAKIQADIEHREQMDQVISRLESDRRALLDLMNNYRAQIETLRARLQEQQEAFDKRLEGQTAQLEAEGFKQAVRMYEQAKPRQTKQMFMNLIEAGAMGREQVVQYLSAMQPRKAKRVIGEFKSEQEVAIATVLIEGLRQRGIELTDSTLADRGGAR